MRRNGFTLVEVCVAAAAVAVLGYVVWAAVHSAAGAYAKGEVSLDQLARISSASERIARDVREARQLIHPAPGAAPTPFVFLRNFEGQFVCWYTTPDPKHPDKLELRRALLTAGTGLPAAERVAAAYGLDGMRFAQNDTGLMSWGMFAGDSAVLGAAGRKNQ